MSNPTVVQVLVITALVLAIVSIFVVAYPLLAAAVICLAVSRL